MSADDPQDSFSDPTPPRIDGDRVMFACATCGKELLTLRSRAGQTTSCPQCGDPVTVPDTGFVPDQIEPPDFVNCPMCGADNPRGAKTCSVCGERLQTETPPEVDPRGTRFRRRVGTVSLGETFSRGWELCTEHFGILLGGAALVGVLLMVAGCFIGGPLGVVAQVANGNFGQPPRRASVEDALVMTGVNQIAQVLTTAITALLFAGYVRLRLNLARRGRAKIDDLFNEREVWASAALTSIVYNVLLAMPGVILWAIASAGDGGMRAIGFDPIMQPGIPGMVMFDFDPVLAPISLVVFLVQMVIGVFFWPYLFLCVDYKMSGLTPLSAAWEATKGSRLALLGLTIIQGIIMFVASLPCGLGLLLAGPYICALNIAAYEQISGNHAVGRQREE
ncbi:zinc ribbon domain-containing protein [Alienimonas chondri]|uniref:Zinc ribbon domain-containing protein n=1 Tax=Alienimonas chondri TaxID=2681879 RepID=A0ABX1V9A0_9PLAN|nr:zinc ribbon domain-containing protein [Alienimonas chondri]NNJ24658.1 hypothetical protein [Alienimonas chondri]